MPHPWKFFRAGGFDQVQLSSGEDLLQLGELDQKLWVALGCPVKGVELDTRTLELLDTEKDGRIRAPELIAACKWAGRMLKNPDDLLKAAPELPVAAINDSHEEGRALIAAANAMLDAIGKPKLHALSVADATEGRAKYGARALNGDGIVPPANAGDPKLVKAGEDLIACVGAADDKSGKPGYDAERLKKFFAAIDAHVAWLDAGEGDAAVMPLKDATRAAFAAFEKVRPKVDDYFARCRLAAFDDRALQALNREEKEYLSAVAKDLSITASEVSGFPIARIAAGRALPLEQALNPAWAAAVADLRTKVVEPLLGARKELAEADWLAVREKLAAHEKWVQAKAGAEVEKLGATRVRELAAPPVRTALIELVAKDTEEAAVQKSVESVERLVRYHRDLITLANNFVSFRDFYSRRKPAIFQAGTLYLDQRSCELCLEVHDLAKHSAMAPLSRAYVAYCELQRPASGEKKLIAAVISAGDADNLLVGRNGLFYDRQGRDWDATIVKLVDNPISVRQAFWAPYKKALAFVEEQVNKRAAAADAEAGAKLTAHADDVGKSAFGEKPGAPPPKKIDIGTVAALGVAVGGIAAAFGALLEAFFGLGLWMPAGFLGLILLISGPSMAIATLKLRQRSLGPLLDANGWALNAPAKVNIPFGGSLTKRAELPKGSERNLSDPYAVKTTPWGWYLFFAICASVALAWWLGRLDHNLPEGLRRHRSPPAAIDGGHVGAKMPSTGPTGASP